jgi:hypothetical protein
MNYPLLVSLCFLPLAIILIVTKISLWMSSSAAEIKYVKEDAKLTRGPFLPDVYGDIDKENETDADW